MTDALYALGTMLVVAGFVFRKGLHTLWTEWMTHRERMHAQQIDEIVQRTVEAHTMRVKAMLDEMILDINTRTNSNVG